MYNIDKIRKNEIARWFSDNSERWNIVFIFNNFFVFSVILPNKCLQRVLGNKSETALWSTQYVARSVHFRNLQKSVDVNFLMIPFKFIFFMIDIVLKTAKYSIQFYFDSSYFIWAICDDTLVLLGFDLSVFFVLNY